MAKLSTQSNRSLETQLVIECAQTQLSVAGIERIRRILSESPDWSFIFKIAARNAVSPLVSWNLTKIFESLLPPEIRNELSTYLIQHTRSNMLMTGKLVRIVNLFKSKNIPILPIKGPLLAARAYGNLAFRFYSDLDVLVKLEDFKESVELLKSEGFNPVSSISWLHKTNWHISRKKDIRFVDEKGTIVELHWKLSGSHFSLPLEIGRLWEHSETANLAGVEVKSLLFDDLLIYLCLHGSRHSWERFAWICDVNELTASKSDIDWEGLSKKAKRLGCENTLELGLCLVYEFFGKKFPLPNWEEIENDPTMKEIVAQIRLRLFADESSHWEIGERYLYHLKLKEKMLDRFKLHLHYNFWYLRIIFSPNERDKDVFHLPPHLTPLYYVLRPIRLAFNYASRKEPEK